jgi:AraC family transcriptional regulator
VQTEQRWVAALTHRGAPVAFSDTLRTFIAWRRAERRSPHVSATINLYHDDGEEASEDRIHITLCAETPQPITPTPDGLRPLLMPAGRAARILVIGGDAAVRRKAAWLLREWLPASGEHRADFPLYVERLAFFPDVAEEDAKVAMFLMLRDASCHTSRDFVSDGSAKYGF